MIESRRRTFGVLALLLLVGGTATLAVWRLSTAAHIGWAGMSYMPPVTKKTTRQPSFPAFKPGSVFMIYPGGPAERAGIQRGDRVISINGISASDLKQLGVLNAKTRSGDVLIYEVERGGRTLKIPVRFDSPTRSTAIVSVLAMNVAVGITFLLIGFFVFWRRPDDSRTLVFYIMTLAAAASFVSSSLAQIETSNIRGIAVEPSVVDLTRGLIIAAITLFFAPLLLHLALIFPVERPVMLRRRRTVFQWIYGAPVYVCTAIGLFLAFIAVVTSAAEAKQKGVARATAIGFAVVIGVLAVVAIVRIIMRVRRSGLRNALIESPFENMTLLLAFFTATAAMAGWATTRSHSPVPLIIVTVVCVLVLVTLLTSYPIATVISLFRSYRESGVEERRQVKWPLWGSMVAVGGRLLLLIVGLGIGFSMTFGGNTRISPFVMTLPDLAAKALYTLIPISFAFAILKYRLMNIDVIIRRTVLYSILTAVIFVLYAVLVAGLGTALVKFAGMKNQTMLIASTVVIALVTVPLRNRLQQMVDRNLFRERRDYALALRNLGNAIGTATSVSAFLRYGAEQIQQALQNRLVLIALRRDNEFVATAKVGVADELIGTLRIPASSVDLGANSVPDVLKKLGTVMIVPIAAHREPIGLLALGSRLSDEDYSPTDVELVLAAASQIAVGIENVRLRDEEADFEQARAMQQILLPKSFPHLDGFQITGLWQPARSVGGDYFDTLALGPSRAGVCIADVAGKGMPAALLMANLQAAVKATAAQDAAPAAVCERVKTIVSGNLAGGKFISFFYGVLDAPSRTFSYCNAGHNPPVIARTNGTIERLMRGGPALCRLFSAAVHEQETVKLESGDRVILFTDGVSEARRGEEEFGEDRLIELILAERHQSAVELQETILRKLRYFTAGEFGDDVTMVVIAVE